ncbi:MAG: heat-inducible transcriptional repressor HrcA [Halodesulfovibrio sp.]
MSLAQRETDVLSTIIESYITTALPVGSRTVANASRLKLSAASMRNTMADLTDKGYLEQPHTSAGRIPTAKAFRLYVDSLLRMRPISRDERDSILGHLTLQGLEISQMLQQATAMVSTLSHEVALVLAPGGNDVRWRRMDFSLVADRLVLAVLVLDGGMIRNRVVRLDEKVTADDLVHFGNYLNSHYTGLTLSEARSRILNELHRTEAHLEELCARALGLARLAFSGEADVERQLFVEGTLTMLDKAEFTDSARMRELLALLDERTRLLKLLNNTMRSADVSVSIAPDMPEAEHSFAGLSVISAPYGGETPLGVVSVIGPLRMDYGTIVPVVDCISKSLSTLLKDRFSA